MTFFPRRTCDRKAANTQTAPTRGIQRLKTDVILDFYLVIFRAPDVKPLRIEKLGEQQHAVHA